MPQNRRRLLLGFLCTFSLLLLLAERSRAQNNAPVPHIVQPGDTWAALASRYGTTADSLQALNPHPNRQRQPTIGASIWVPDTPTQTGRLLRLRGGALATAVAYNQSPWQIAQQAKNLIHPYRRLLHHPLMLPGDQPVRELPVGFTTLELSQSPARPGQALGVRGLVNNTTAISARLSSDPFSIFVNGRNVVGVTGTSAFFGTGAPELMVQPAGQPAWVQPWRFLDDDQWAYQQITLTGAAAEIDQAAIQAERERLFVLWEVATPQPQFDAAFREPIDSYLSLTSAFGARRSYNGGPYRSYHEGVDYGAYGGTPVLAPAAGTVIVAEFLYVRGGAVIIDHGLGIYSGFYHMSSVNAAVGDVVSPGQMVGEVGTTGLSTGNHLHWDMLTDAVWIDGQAWLAQGMGCWILAGWGRPCTGAQ